MPSVALVAMKAIRIWSIRSFSASERLPTHARRPKRTTPEQSLVGRPTPLRRADHHSSTSAFTPWIATESSAARATVRPAVAQCVATRRVEPGRGNGDDRVNTKRLHRGATSSRRPRAPTRGFRAPGYVAASRDRRAPGGAANRIADTIAAATIAATVTDSTRLVSSVGRMCGRCATKMIAASLTPRRVTRAHRIDATAMNAIVPRPVGPRPRAMTTTAANSPALPRICAQNSTAGPRANASVTWMPS